MNRVGGYTPTKVNLAALRAILDGIDQQIGAYEQETLVLEGVLATRRRLMGNLKHRKVQVRNLQMWALLGPLELGLEKFYRQNDELFKDTQYFGATEHPDGWFLLQAFRDAPTVSDRLFALNDAPPIFAPELSWNKINRALPITAEQRRQMDTSQTLERRWVEGPLVWKIICIQEVFYNPETDEMSAPVTMDRLGHLLTHIPADMPVPE